ncbi:MAG TPA: Uma2 family endonuclease [Oscillatoriaceae cyanobacterium M33_DOE_052]|uniref:Uma2 family endonuclease n=1 Tax=Planktothricoides sp. SpSt-374 TaxID=2282167 RepID=A0A7C3VP37_9CYAN|nr:Uma2 family endonuclease [Oscillatoriaceae cyanobacterium M33_DOE_052]
MVQIQEPEIPTFPPGDLWSDEPPLETYRHFQQLMLLLSSLERFWSNRLDFFAGANLTVYYSTRERKDEDLRGPDFFVVLNTERRERKSWVVWQEDGKYPNVVIEVLSDSTAAVDRNKKKLLYQDVWRTPDYFWFHPYTMEFKGFTLVHGKYVEIPPNEQSWLWSDELQLYLGIFNQRLRFFTPEGELVPTPEEAEIRALSAVELERQRAEVERERADAERQQAEVERQRAEVERQQVEVERQKNAILRQKLLELGINPDEIG